MTTEPQAFLIYNRWWLAFWGLALTLVQALLAVVILSRPVTDGRIEMAGFVFPRWAGLAFVTYSLVSWVWAMVNCWNMRLVVDNVGVSFRPWKGKGRTIAWTSLGDVVLLSNPLGLGPYLQILLLKPVQGRELRIPVAAPLYGRMADFTEFREALTEQGVPIIERD